MIDYSKIAVGDEVLVKPVCAWRTRKTWRKVTRLSPDPLMPVEVAYNGSQHFSVKTTEIYDHRPRLGRPRELEQGKQVNVYLDPDSIRRAVKLGAGNMSLGIRMALEGWRK